MLVLLLVFTTAIALLIIYRLLSGRAPLFRAPLMDDNIALQPRVVSAPVHELPHAIDLPLDPQDALDSPTDKIEKVNRLLLEKNRAIDRLQTELEAERAHRLEFMNVKSLLDEEIQKLKEQNRALRSHNKQA